MTDSGAESDVRAAIDRITDALNASDAAALDATLSDRPGSTLIGSDPDEWWTKQELLAGIREAMSVEGDQIRAEQGDVAVHVVGDVAWTAGTGKFTNGTGAERAIRMTGVFVREDGQWRAVQMHASIGVPNSDIFQS